MATKTIPNIVFSISGKEIEISILETNGKKIIIKPLSADAIIVKVVDA